MGTVYDEATRTHKSKYAAHLKKFTTSGGHAFIPNYVHKNIALKGWDGWGVGSNFIMPLQNADVTLAAARSSEGLKTLEEACGIPPGSWYDSSEPGTIFRYFIDFNALDELLEGLHLRMPTGEERGADAAQFRAGGHAGAANADEAVIDGLDHTRLDRLCNPEPGKKPVIIRKSITLENTPRFNPDARIYMLDLEVEENLRELNEQNPSLSDEELAVEFMKTVKFRLFSAEQIHYYRSTWA